MKDYSTIAILIFITYSASNAQIFGPDHVVDDNLPGIYTALTTDLDQDGIIDILASTDQTNEIYWYKGDSNSQFTKHLVYAGSTKPSLQNPVDLDNDGDLDIISIHYQDGVIWHINNGDESFSPQYISTVHLNASMFFTADFDSDGDLDFGTSAVVGDSLLWYENDGQQYFTPHLIDNAIGSWRTKAFDLDQDGKTDIVSTSGYRLVWFRNIGGSFDRQTIVTLNSSPPHSSIRDFEIVDMDDDGDWDIITAGTAGYQCSTCRVYWMKNDGSEVFTSGGLGSTSVLLAREIEVDDYDLDGDLDILVAQDGYKLFLNNGNNYMIATSASDFFDVITVIDLDEDLDHDIVKANFEEGILLWSENILIDNGNYLHSDVSEGFGISRDSLGFYNLTPIAANHLSIYDDSINIDGDLNGEEAFQQRGSNIAGDGLNWVGTELEVDPLLFGGTSLNWNVLQWDINNVPVGTELLWNSSSSQLEIDYTQSGTFYRLNSNTAAFHAPVQSETLVSLGGMPVSGSHLSLYGSMISNRLRIDKFSDGWPDYVFDPAYDPKPLSEVEEFIRREGHLPGLMDEAFLREVGLDLKWLNSVLLKKLEELTMYILEREQELTDMEIQIKQIIDQQRNLEQLLKYY